MNFAKIQGMKSISILFCIFLFSNSTLAVVSGFTPEVTFIPQIFKIKSKRDSSSVCTGVLYERNKILTAFHCIALSETSDLYIENDFCTADRCGSLALNDTFVTVRANQTYNSITNFRELHNDGSVALSLLNFLKKEDFAVLELKENLTIDPIELISSTEDLNFPLPSFFTLICGYGYYSPRMTSWSNVLYGENHCNYFEVDIFDENYYLVKPSKTSSIARGDSGTALVIDIHGRKQIYGILYGYGRRRGLIGSIANSFVLLLEDGYAIPVNKEVIEEIELVPHNPLFTRPMSRPLDLQDGA